MVPRASSLAVTLALIIGALAESTTLPKMAAVTCCPRTGAGRVVKASVRTRIRTRCKGIAQPRLSSHSLSYFINWSPSDDNRSPAFNLLDGRIDTSSFVQNRDRIILSSQGLSQQG